MVRQLLGQDRLLVVKRLLGQDRLLVVRRLLGQDELLVVRRLLGQRCIVRWQVFPVEIITHTDTHVI